MRYDTGAAFRQALEQRLLDRSRSKRESLVRLRKTVVFDRLLARLMVAAPGRWVLKGALALAYRLTAVGRTTKNLDLVRGDDGANMLQPRSPAWISYVVPLRHGCARNGP